MKVSFLELQRFKVQRVDWNKIIVDLNGAKVTNTAIGSALGLDRKTILHYKNDGYRPKYEEAQALLRMHEHYCGNLASASS
jgi:hypothetical protein